MAHDVNERDRTRVLERENRRDVDGSLSHQGAQRGRFGADAVVRNGLGVDVYDIGCCDVGIKKPLLHTQYLLLYAGYFPGFFFLLLVDRVVSVFAI